MNIFEADTVRSFLPADDELRNQPEFSVWVFVKDDWHFPLERYTDAETAVRTAKRATAMPGPAERIIITDGADCTVFEWKKGQGVTWPAPKGATP